MLNPDRISVYLLDKLFNNHYLLMEFLSGFIPIIASLFYLKSFKKHFTILFIYSILIALLEIIGGLFAANNKPNHFIYLWFYFFETILLSVFYLKTIVGKKSNLIILLITFIILIALVYNMVNGNDLMNNYAGSIQSLGFIAISLMGFYFILSKLHIIKLKNSVLFWLNTGNLFYFSGRLFVCLFMMEVMDIKIKNLDGYWYIVSILLVIQRIGLAISISQTKYNNQF